jgi:hypothetical protein
MKDARYPMRESRTGGALPFKGLFIGIALRIAGN